jgi:hypothetical protein
MLLLFLVLLLLLLPGGFDAESALRNFGVEGLC